MIPFVAHVVPAFHAVWVAAEEEQFDADQVSPGVGGFLIVFAMAIAIFLLGFDLVRRLRRSRYRAEVQEDIAAEIAERDGVDRTDTSTSVQPPSADEADPRS